MEAAVDPEGVAGAPAVILTVGAYSAREEYLQNMEDEGQISFKYVVNDGQEHNSIWCDSLPLGSCNRTLGKGEHRAGGDALAK